MPDTLESHFDAHHRSLLAQTRRRIGAAGDAEDIVQETWMRAAAAIEGGSPIRNLAGFLHRVAANLSVDHLRRDRARAHLRVDFPQDAIAEVPCPAPRADQAIMEAQAEAAFDAAISRLPTRARRVLLLNRIEGWTYPRIAKHLGISERTVSNDLALAIATCMDFLSRHGE